MSDESKRDEVAITVVRNIIAMHEGSREITIDDAAKMVRSVIDREVTAANAATLDVATRALETAAKLSMGEPPPESPNSPEEIRGRLLDWLSQSKARRFELRCCQAVWETTLTVQRGHIQEVKGRGGRLNHLDAIEDALDSVGHDTAGGGVTAGT